MTPPDRDFSLTLSRSVLALVGLLLLPGLFPQPVAAQVKIDWEKYHDHEEVTRIVHDWAEEYPNLVQLEQIGESVQGRELWLLTLTNQETGPAENKPALWIDGNSDGGEIMSKEVALYLIDYLLRNHGSDARVTDILDSKTLYIEPDANPDPGEQVIQPPETMKYQGVSRTGYLAPVDEDGDREADEDPPEDINGDGLVVAMRRQDPAGEWKPHPEDERLLVRRKPGDDADDGPFYRRWPTEGVDNDGDGRINEDWLGGWDSNRMYPANWQPGYRQIGAPPYPLYTPEPKAIVDAVLERPNIAALISMHTSGRWPGGTLWEAPASVYPREFPAFDMQNLFTTFGDRYDSIMRREGYPHSQATAANVRRQEPRGQIRNTLLDWAYINLGMMGWSPEIWSEGVYDYNGDEQISDMERMRWNEEEWNGRLFVGWQTAEHPELGQVEVGGWRNDFDAHGLTPPEGVPYRLRQINPWFLYVLESLPDLEMTDPQVEALGDGLYRVSATVVNTGLLDTSSTEHGATIVETRGWETGVPSKVPIAPPVEAWASSEDARVVTDERKKLGHFRGRNEGGRSEISDDWPNSKRVSWTVHGEAGSTVRLAAKAPRAGLAEVTVKLGQ